MSITTHILDTSRGKPAAGVLVTLHRSNPDGSWSEVARGETDGDGRLRSLTVVESGTYRITFDTGTYFRERHVETFFPEVTIMFQVTDHGHYHVPLLLSPWGYSTYRGS